ncbi:LacI family DNA-binding transcriptional regulator [Tessaracoccus sp. G1721]
MTEQRSSPRSPRRPTLDLVAREAGVSKATVSKVLNHRPNIAAETRAIVEAAIQRLGYVPSTGPRVGSQLNQVNLVFDTLINVYSMQVLDAVVASAEELGIDVVVNVLQHAPSARTAPLSEAWVRDLGARGSAGVIVVTSELTAAQRRQFRQAGLSVVVVDPLNPLDGDTISIGSTNFAGGMQATQHLLDLGHRRIAYAGGPPNSAPSRERLQGYRNALEAAGVPLDGALVVQLGFTHEAGAEMAEELLGLDEPPTAIFAGCDASALAVLEVARRRGLRVPEDLSVVGFDDTYAAVSAAPPLTTVHQPIADIGRVALRTLLQLTKGEQPDSHHIQLATQLVVRESTAFPKR